MDDSKTEHDRIELAAYLDGEVTEAQARHIRARLRTDAGYAGQLQQLERIRTMLAMSIEQPGLHERLIADVRQEDRRFTAARLRRRLLTLTAAAAVMLLLALAIYMLPASLGDSGPGSTAALAPGLSPRSPGSAAGEEHAPAVPIQVIQASETAEAPAPGSFELLGTITGENPIAIIGYNQDGEAKSRSFSIGDTITEGATLLEVEKGKAVLDVNGARIELATGDPEAVDPLEHFAGVWDMFSGASGASGRVGRVIVRPHNRQLHVTSVDAALSYTLAIRLTGRKVILRSDGLTGLIPLEMAGTLSEDYKTLDGRVTIDPKGNPTDPNDPEQHFVLQWVMSLSDEGEGARFAAEQQCKVDIRAMFEVLERYAQNHDDLFPAQLADLVPGYIPGLTLFEDTEDRRVEYRSGASLNPKIEPIDLPARQPSETFAQRLQAHEQTLKDTTLPDAVFRKPVIKLTSQSAQAKVFIDAYGYITARPLDPASLPTSPEGATRLGEMRATCQNNLKQLGLILRMFELEQDIYPAGWLSTYPEYITDPTVLSSPLDEPGTDSYALVLPCADVAQMLADMGVDPDDQRAAGRARSRIPSVILRGEWPGPQPSRHVLFADGHVEVVRTSSSEWRDQIQPYLRTQ